MLSLGCCPAGTEHWSCSKTAAGCCVHLVVFVLTVHNLPVEASSMSGFDAACLYDCHTWTTVGAVSLILPGMQARSLRLCRAQQSAALPCQFEKAIVQGTALQADKVAKMMVIPLQHTYDHHKTG